MTKITIEIPEELERRARTLNIELSILIAKIIREQMEKLEKIERIKAIAAKSQATDEDVEEITSDIEQAMEKHYSKYYNVEGS